jgi:hypothetical protein
VPRRAGTIISVTGIRAGLLSTKRPTASGDPDSSKDASTGSSVAVCIEAILRTRPGVFRAALKRISRDSEPVKWAVEHLKLGARLRAEAAKLAGAKRTRLSLQAVRAFEEALHYYCDLLPQPVAAKQMPCPTDAPPPNSAAPDSNDVGIDLVLQAVHRAGSNDPGALEDALKLFAESCTDDMRSRDFRQWLSAGLNRGCALILLGKMSPSAAGSALLQLAIDAYHHLLSEPALHQLRQDCALVYINLAEAQSTLSERNDTVQHAPYLACAMESLATALWQTVPEDYRPLVAPKPEELN